MAKKKMDDTSVTIQKIIKSKISWPLRIILIIAALAGLITSTQTNWNDSDKTPQVSQESYGPVIKQPSQSDIIAGLVKRVIDGDTIVVSVQGEDDRRVRLLGVDTPETVHPNKPVQFYGPEASAYTKKNLTGQPVWLEYDKEPLDRYQRHLAYIWLVEPPLDINELDIREHMFNARLILGGYGRVMIIKPNGRYADLFNKFQDEAVSAKRGLWSSEPAPVKKTSAKKKSK